jgi:hypothetical protein
MKPRSKPCFSLDLRPYLLRWAGSPAVPAWEMVGAVRGANKPPPGWGTFGGGSRLESNLKRECVEESTIGGDQSYVELITCLEMSSSQWNGTKR